jgi:protein-tyrosine phosphatase
MSFEILVLCAGNIGRSPLAAAMLRRGLAVELGVSEDQLEVSGVGVGSAGTGAPEGHQASSRGEAYAIARGLDLSSHRAAQLTETELEAADVIYCMDRQQLAAIAELAPAALMRAELLAGEGKEIPDPHYESDGFFRRVAEQIEEAVAARIPELLERIESS